MNFVVVVVTCSESLIDTTGTEDMSRVVLSTDREVLAASVLADSSSSS